MFNTSAAITATASQTSQWATSWGCVIGAIIAFFIAYDAAPWMSHGERATQLFAAVFGFGFGIAYLYNAWQEHHLQRALADKPYLQPLAALLTRWWISLGISLIAFIVGIYSVSVFLGAARVVRAATVPALVHLLGGTALVVFGLTMIAVTFKVQRQGGLTVTFVLFGFIFPALMLVSGVGRLVVAYRQLVR